MKLFRRGKVDQATMPTELQSYYQAETRERTGVAWLLAFGTVIVTVLVILALFYGGRWTYRKLRPAKKADIVSIQQQNPQGATPESTTNSPNSSNTSTTNTTNNTQNTSTTSTPQTSSTNSADTTSGSTAGSATNTSGLPSTGPGDTLAIFAAVSVLAYVSHRRFLAKG